MAKEADYVGDDSINWSHHWRSEQPPDRKDFNDPNAFDYAKPFLPKAPFTVLEIGCGGGYWATNWKLIGGIYSGVDASQAGIMIAQQRHPELTFYNMKVQDIDPSDFPPISVITSHTFLQHTSRASKQRIFPILHKLLKHDGVMVLQENTEDGNTETTFTREGWILFISDYGFRYVTGTKEGDGRNGMVFVKR